MARATGGNICPACGGQKSKQVPKKEYVPCARCNGAGGKKSGKVWVPCSACNGKGGKNQTTWVWQDCAACGGKGYR